MPDQWHNSTINKRDGSRPGLGHFVSWRAELDGDASTKNKGGKSITDRAVPDPDRNEE